MVGLTGAVESKLPNPAAEADFHVEPVLVKCWVTLGPRWLMLVGPALGRLTPCCLPMGTLLSQSLHGCF